MNTSSQPISRSTVVTDLAVVTTAVIITSALSHLGNIGLYRFCPMLFFLLAGIAIKMRRHGTAEGVVGMEALLPAVLLPMLSCLLIGMPTLSKALCMAAEFSVMTLVAAWTLRLAVPSEEETHRTTEVKRSYLLDCLKIWGAMMLAILAGKVVYYLLKAALVDEPLIRTSIWIQIAVTAGYTLLFALFTAYGHPKQGRQCERDRC